MKRFIAIFMFLSAVFFFAYSAQASGQYIWIANSGENTVSKVDVFTDSVAATINVGEYPFAVAVAQDYVYVGNKVSKTISKIDKITNNVEATILLDQHPVALGLGADGFIYAMVIPHLRYSYYCMAYLYKIDQQTDSKIAELQLRNVSEQYGAIGVNKDNLAYIPYAYSYPARTGIMIVNLDTLTLQGDYTHSPYQYGYNGAGIAIDDAGNGWTETKRVGSQKRIIKITPSGQRTFFAANGNRAELVIGDDGFLWTTDFSDAGTSLVKFNMTDNSYTKYPLSMKSGWAQQIHGLTYLNGYIWITDPTTDTLLKFDPVDGIEVDFIGVGKQPYSVGDTSGYEAARLGFITLEEPDSDGDGVPDHQDVCPRTDSISIIDINGCSGEQLVDKACPCDDTWKNHGQFVSCVANEAENQMVAGLITQVEKDALVSAKAKSSCGKKK